MRFMVVFESPIWGATARIHNRRFSVQCRFKIVTVGYSGNRNLAFFVFAKRMNDLSFEKIAAVGYSVDFESPL
jgi:hypothetical protein